MKNIYTAEEIKEIENLFYFLQTHNKNLTKKQDYAIDDLKIFFEKLKKCYN